MGEHGRQRLDGLSHAASQRLEEIGEGRSWVARSLSDAQTVPSVALPSPLSTTSEAGQTSPAASRGNPISLIVHPSHEPASYTPSPKDGSAQPAEEKVAAAKSRMIIDACGALGVSIEDYHIL